jgi:branched-chain amino acid transport system ATP-binding protein
MVEQVGQAVRDINERGVTVLLVEQNVNLALGVASRGIVLQVGRVVLDQLLPISVDHPHRCHRQ